METALKKQPMRELFQAILKLKNTDECEKFFRDLCTLNELKSMSERWQVVQELNKNIPYRAIAQKTGSSTATITRVAHWLHHGTGGYQLMLHRR